MSGELTGEPLLQQIRSMVEAELRCRGGTAQVRVEGQCLIVGKGASEARADLQGSIQQWDSLPDDLRERRVQQIAQLLSEGAQRAPVAMHKRRPLRPGLFSFVRH